MISLSLPTDTLDYTGLNTEDNFPGTADLTLEQSPVGGFTLLFGGDGSLQPYEFKNIYSGETLIEEWVWVRDLEGGSNGACDGLCYECQHWDCATEQCVENTPAGDYNTTLVVNNTYQDDKGDFLDWCGLDDYYYNWTGDDVVMMGYIYGQYSNATANCDVLVDGGYIYTSEVLASGLTWSEYYNARALVILEELKGKFEAWVASDYISYDIAYGSVTETGQGATQSVSVTNRIPKTEGGKPIPDCPESATFNCTTGECDYTDGAMLQVNITTTNHPTIQLSYIIRYNNETVYSSGISYHDAGDWTTAVPSCYRYANNSISFFGGGYDEWNTSGNSPYLPCHWASLAGAYYSTMSYESVIGSVYPDLRALMNAQGYSFPDNVL